MRRSVRLLSLLVALTALPAAAQENPLELSLAGGQALMAGDLDEAERLFEAARALDDGLPVVWLGLAEVRELRGRIDEALPLARRAQELAPDEAVVHRLVGRLLARLGADEAALTALARARELGPKNPEPYLLSALLLRSGGKAGEAVTLLEEALAAGAEASGVRRELVLLLLSEGRPEDAVPLAEAAIERYPGEPGLELALGLALAALPERREEAPRWLEKALAGGVEQPARVRFELGRVLLETGQVAAARPHLEEAAEAMPTVPTVWYRLARARQGDGDREGAEAAMGRFRELSRRADEADPGGKRVGAALDEAQALAGANRLTEALARVRELLAETPGLPRALALEAKVLYSLRRLDEALAGIRSAIEAAPGAVEYRYLEGLFLAELKRTAEAEAAFERALSLEPALGEAWEQLARLALAGDRAEEAVMRFERALELGPDSEALRLFYAEALDRVGRPEESREQMEAYRRLHEGGSGSGS